jgi:sarcosine oxidase, subunit gamma
VTVELRELKRLTKLNLRADPRLAGALGSAAGCALPLAPNTATRAGDRGVLWLGPDEWLLVAPPGCERGLETTLRSAIGALFATVVDVSADRTVFELSGPRAPDVLAKGCSLDLHRRAFVTGQCAQTLLGQAQVIIEQVGDEPAYRLFVRPSLAPYLVAWLEDAMLEFRNPGGERA